MKKIEFTKMHGLGNDFILIEDCNLPEKINYEKLAREICDRHFGVGADGLIIINPKKVLFDTDTAWRIFNSDGSEPEMCGNGIRCFAKYVYNKGIVTKRSFTVKTLAGVISPHIEPNGLITVDMGEPILNPTNIPVNLPLDIVVNYPITIEDKEFRINCVSMGNPHCVIFSNETIDTEKYGSIISGHKLFPQKTNVEFVKIISRGYIKVDVWERGCGITLACGTGACACTVASVLNKLTENMITVELPGGKLNINYDQTSNRIFMTGEAEMVFEGVYSFI